MDQWLCQLSCIIDRHLVWAKMLEYAFGVKLYSNNSGNEEQIIFDTLVLKCYSKI